MSHQQMDYVGRIRELGYRMTPQRQIVLDVVCEHGGHATAGQVFDMVRSKAPAINRATVYRVLDFFCELQFIARTEIAGRTVYELVYDAPHHHLVCRQCGSVQVLADYHFDHLADHLLHEHGFEADLTHLAVSGICADCRQTAAS